MTEEPKCTCKRPDDYTCDFCDAKQTKQILEETKQETLEEAAYQRAVDRKWEPKSLETRRVGNEIIEAVKFGAKWQAERMYSEEEVITLLQKYRYDLSSGKTSNIGDTTPIWFEQFKKK